jgi:hypothetical protein
MANVGTTKLKCKICGVIYSAPGPKIYTFGGVCIGLLCAECSAGYEQQLKCTCPKNAGGLYYKCPQHGKSQFCKTVCVHCLKVVEQEGPHACWQGKKAVAGYATKPPKLLTWDDPDSDPIGDIKKYKEMLAKDYHMTLSNISVNTEMFEQAFGKISEYASKTSAKLKEMDNEIKATMHTADDPGVQHEGLKEDCTINCCVAARRKKEQLAKGYTVAASDVKLMTEGGSITWTSGDNVVITSYSPGGGGGFASGGFVSGSANAVGGSGSASKSYFVSEMAKMKYLDSSMYEMKWHDPIT